MLWLYMLALAKEQSDMWLQILNGFVAMNICDLNLLLNDTRCFNLW